jgi:hypothetical protein
MVMSRNNNQIINVYFENWFNTWWKMEKHEWLLYPVAQKMAAKDAAWSMLLHFIRHESEIKRIKKGGGYNNQRKEKYRGSRRGERSNSRVVNNVFDHETYSLQSVKRREKYGTVSGDDYRSS